jgi:hypothetical protein
VLNGAIWETFMFLWSCDSASKYAEEWYDYFVIC